VLSDDEGALTLLSRTPTEQTLTGVERASIPSVLAQRFGLPGWTLDSATGLPVPAG
jgi:hypothetical protein